ncbi:MAG: photosystem I reaction center subunit XII [cyanobacterium endosymbiont of Rhopalodia gibba]
MSEFQVVVALIIALVPNFLPSYGTL